MFGSCFRTLAVIPVSDIKVITIIIIRSVSDSHRPLSPPNHRHLTGSDWDPVLMTLLCRGEGNITIKPSTPVCVTRLEPLNPNSNKRYRLCPVLCRSRSGGRANLPETRMPRRKRHCVRNNPSPQRAIRLSTRNIPSSTPAADSVYKPSRVCHIAPGPWLGSTGSEPSPNAILSGQFPLGLFYIHIVVVVSPQN